ncbi:MAG TPA: hypothetical protein VFA33_24350 [Bryobacteraceae bacterium]|nr:hypothetical protein [Bryobacteraceae bacterium]
MQQVIGILLGVLLSGGTSLALGTLLIRALRIRFERTEEVSLAFVAGSACHSQILFLFCAMHLAREGVFVVIGLAAGTAAVCLHGSRTGAPAFAPLPRRWRWLLGLPFAAFGLVYLVNAMAPEMSPDGSAYHLPLVAHYLRVHGFARITWNFYASFPQGIELLFLPALALGRHSAAALVHFLFLLDLPLLMICYGRRFGFPIPAMAAAFLVFASPVVGLDGTTAYVDAAVAAILFALFYILSVWEAEGDSRLLILIGVLCGFSYAAKYTAAIAIPYALGVMAWKLWRTRRPLARPMLTVCGLAAFFILPWMIKNTIFVRNPVAPFANRLFPNPYVRVSFEQDYRRHMRRYLLTSWLDAPLELTVRGERLQGFFGPVFLLMPLALLSLRRRAGRRLVLAGVCFGLPWFLNIGTRFLIPALPPLTLALTSALDPLTAWLPPTILLHAFLSWYAAPAPYFDRYAPRIANFPWRAALRLEPEEQYLARNSPGYRLDGMIERLVPPGETVLSLEQIPEAWTTRRILVAYNAAENQTLADMLYNAMVPRSWRSLPADGSVSVAPVGSNLRAAATRELAARGIRYLLVSPAAFGANDFRQEAAAWGMQLVGESDGTRLFLLEPAGQEPQIPAPAAATDQAPVPAGVYDDADSRIHLRAAWMRDTQFPEPYQHTLTYSNIPGATISLAFVGTAVTYVYTRARNRGIAEVVVDGVPKGRIDLYSAATVWQSRTKFRGLGPGRHVIQIRVTGEHNPQANDGFVDLDALIVE